MSFFDMERPAEPRRMRVKDLRGFEWVHDWYVVTDAGAVYSERNLRRVATLTAGRASRAKGLVRRLKESQGPNGYVTVGLCGPDKRANVKVHRLVAAAFCPKWDPSMLVDHKDSNRKNNQAGNLHTVDYKSNSVNNFKRFINDAGLTKQGGVRLVAVNSDNTSAHLFESTGACARFIQKDHSGICKAAKHNTNLINGEKHKNRTTMGYRTYGGYRVFRFDDLTPTIKNKINELL